MFIFKVAEMGFFLFFLPSPDQCISPEAASSQSQIWPEPVSAGELLPPAQKYVLQSAK